MDRETYISERGISRIFRISPDGVLTTVAGQLGGGFGYAGDGGGATHALLAGPLGMARDH